MFINTFFSDTFFRKLFFNFLFGKKNRDTYNNNVITYVSLSFIKIDEMLLVIITNFAIANRRPIRVDICDERDFVIHFCFLRKMTKFVFTDLLENTFLILCASSSPILDTNRR